MLRCHIPLQMIYKVNPQLSRTLLSENLINRIDFPERPVMNKKGCFFRDWGYLELCAHIFLIHFSYPFLCCQEESSKVPKVLDNHGLTVIKQQGLLEWVINTQIQKNCMLIQLYQLTIHTTLQLLSKHNLVANYYLHIL